LQWRGYYSIGRASQSLVNTATCKRILFLFFCFYNARAVLCKSTDDCLSAVSDDVVAAVFELFGERGITCCFCSQRLPAAAARFFGRELRLGENTEVGWSEHRLGDGERVGPID